ncbi:hypothetical protein [Algoriphagus formosus]|uniref:hypothetical protein n=1 Tax=Algoriphagus formosus TaxID=2007308 RepID=UPI000C292A50|nr:hypothetical protein [Algoriphagus formosus]
MKKSIYHQLGVLALALSVAACGNQNTSTNENVTEEVKETMELGHELVFENDFAKVMKVSLAPGTSQPSHEGENRIIYSLNDYTIEWEEQGENKGEQSWKKGDVHFHEAGDHAAKNNGTTAAEWLVFTKKNTELPSCEGNSVNNDVNTVSSDYTKVLIDNDIFKVTEVSLPSGASIPMHAGINRMIYSVSDFQIAYESDKEGKSEKQFAAGDIHWHEACQHALENIGETEAKFIVVAYKRMGN